MEEFTTYAEMLQRRYSTGLSTTNFNPLVVALEVSMVNQLVPSIEPSRFTVIEVGVPVNTTCQAYRCDEFNGHGLTRARCRHATQ